MLELWRSCVCLIKTNMLLSWRNTNDVIITLLFFILVVLLFPFAVGPEPQQLAQLAGGILWIAALLALLLSLPDMFKADYQDGSLEQWLISPHPLTLLVFARIVAHWLTLGLPLTLLAPLVGLTLHLPVTVMDTLVLSLAMGTLILSLMGAIAAAITVGLRQANILLPLLVFPLYIPPLILGTASMQAALAGFTLRGEFALMGALLILALMLAPFISAVALKIALE